MNAWKKSLLLVLLLLGTVASLFADPAPAEKSTPANAGEDYYTVAVLPFSERGEGIKDQGRLVSDLLFAKLVQNPNIWIVERENLKKILDELELNASGVVNPAQAAKIGQMVGARILVTGSVFKFKNNTYIIAKVIGTETSKVKGDAVNGTDGLDRLAEKLGENISTIISNEAKDLMPKVRDLKDVISELKASLKNVDKPKLYIKINEESLTVNTIDPAAETELQKICKDVGFELTDNKNDAEIILQGEAFSQFATRRGNLISVSARVELKAIDKNENVIAVDCQSGMAVGLSEAVTGKTAIQEAAAKIAERMLPKLTKKAPVKGK